MGRVSLGVREDGEDGEERTETSRGQGYPRGIRKRV